jgi:O-antigen/teichoic acid export membrane protein
LSKKDAEKETVNSFYSASIIIALLSFLIVSVSAIAPEFIYGVDDPVLILSIALSIFMLGLSAVFKGLVTGKGAFMFVGFVALVEPIFKVSFAILGRVFDLGLFVVNLGTVFGSIATVISFLVLARKIYGKLSINFRHSFESIKVAFRAVRYSIVYLFMITAFFTLDIILVKRIAADIDADLYAKLSLVGKIIFFGVGPVTVVFFNRFITRGPKADLLISNLVVALVGMVPIVPLTVFPGILEILFSTQFDREIASVFLFGSLFLALAFLNAHYMIARKSFLGVPLLLIALSVFIYTIQTSGGDLNQIVGGYFLGNLISFVSLFVCALGINYQLSLSSLFGAGKNINSNQVQKYKAN